MPLLSFRIPTGNFIVVTRNGAESFLASCDQMKVLDPDPPSSFDPLVRILMQSVVRRQSQGQITNLVFYPLAWDGPEEDKSGQHHKQAVMFALDPSQDAEADLAPPGLFEVFRELGLQDCVFEFSHVDDASGNDSQESVP